MKKILALILMFALWTGLWSYTTKAAVSSGDTAVVDIDLTYLQLEPSEDSLVVKGMPYGSKMTVFPTDVVGWFWAKTWNGKEVQSGYILMEFVDLWVPKKTMRVWKKNLKLMSKPGRGKVVKKLPNNAKVTVKKLYGQYAKVSYKKGKKTYTGYVESIFLKG